MRAGLRAAATRLRHQAAAVLQQQRGAAEAAAEAEARRGAAAAALSGRPEVAAAALWARAPPQYLDFSQPQSYASRAVGVLRGPLVTDEPQPPAAARGDPAPGVPSWSAVLALRGLPHGERSEADGAVWAGAGRVRDEDAAHRATELAMELRGEGVPPHHALLELLADPTYQLTSDGAAVVVRELDKVAERLAQQGALDLEKPLWTSVVYPLYAFLVSGLRRGHGVSLMRALEQYLHHAAARGEVSATYAAYYTERIKHTAGQWHHLRQLEHSVATGDLQTVVQKFAGDDELDLRLFTVLTHHYPDFYEMFPRQQPQPPAKLLEALRVYEVVFVLHSSYLLSPPPGQRDGRSSVGARLKELLELVVSGDDDEVLLVPFWTLQQLLEGALDAPEEVATATRELLQAMAAREGGKVRFVWCSELLPALVHGRPLQASLDHKDDRVLAFTSWLHSHMPGVLEQDERAQAEEEEAAEVELERARLYGKSKSLRTKHRLGMLGREAPRKALRISDVSHPPQPQQGVILLAHDVQLQNHARALGLWSEPSGGAARGAAERDEALRTQWFRFTGAPLSQKRSGVAVRARRARLLRRAKPAGRPQARPGGPKRRVLGLRPRERRVEKAVRAAGRRPRPRAAERPPVARSAVVPDAL
eukprot:TRINITY_DN15162_c0_g1_i1.p1 TRINITY_DN15162_c0_g1~~TRINITY_DN15162_c0_g1_i1.p1  ORF type:complete len:671 (+),score=233.98 TRINITY_DN15162_c0_g1_i1:71-2014(+)